MSAGFGDLCYSARITLSILLANELREKGEAAIGSVNAVKVRRPKSSSDVAAAQSAALRPWFANTRADCVTADDRRCRWLSERGEGSPPEIQFGRCCGSERCAPALVCKHKSGLCNC
jgi:hypothetical protein